MKTESQKAERSKVETRRLRKAAFFGTYYLFIYFILFPYIPLSTYYRNGKHHIQYTSSYNKTIFQNNFLVN